MKRFIILLLVSILLLVGCSSGTMDDSTDTSSTSGSNSAEETIGDSNNSEETENNSLATNTSESDNSQMDLNDPALLQYVQDNVYSTMEETLASDDYIIENVKVAYVSKEYLEELDYNSKANIYFGYTLAEIEEQFKDQQYVFTLGENGETVVKEFEPYDDTYETILKNVAIGSGVILVCVTVSVATGGAGLPVASAIFLASAKTGAIMAVSSGAIGGAAAGIMTGVKTKDVKQALKSASLSASENFKWGAITGVVAGGASQAVTIGRAKKAADGAEEVLSANNKIPDPYTSEERALKKFKGKSQVSYLNGKEVSQNTVGATRPDIVRKTKKGLEAIEVKNYNLEKNANQLYRELNRQVADRAVHMPKGTIQRVVLDVKGRHYPKRLIKDVRTGIKEACNDVYSDIPVSIMY